MAHLSTPSTIAASGDERLQSQPHLLTRFYMTSDLRAATGLTRTHLDFYLREGVIVPTARTESGYLLFDEGELATLRQVIAWRGEGIGIREIRARLARHAA
ncbi:MAG: MerR family transcriptional regulator [Thermomicrobiales bacterium]